MAAPRSVIQLMKQAKQHIDASEWQKADRLIRASLKQKPNDTKILTWHANVQRELGHPKKAYEILSKAIDISPRNVDLKIQRIKILAYANRFTEAVAGSTLALQSHPDNIDLLKFRGKLKANMGNNSGARADFQTAFDLNSKDITTLTLLVNAIINERRPPMPEHLALELVERQPFESKNHSRLATFLFVNNDFDGAMLASEKALELDPNNMDAVACTAEILESRDETDAALEVLSPHVESGKCEYSILLAWMRVNNRRKDWKATIDIAENWLASPGDQAAGHRPSLIYHRLGHAQDKAGLHEDAFESWIKGNRLHQHLWNPKEQTEITSRLIESYSAEAMQRLPRSACTNKRPIFIVGMFRSGTTLLDQVLSMHPEVHAAGELSDLFRLAGMIESQTKTGKPYPECISHVDVTTLTNTANEYLKVLEYKSGNASRITDKLPINYMNIGMFSLLFPNARFIHCKRDPLDTCLSCYGNSFAYNMSFTADLEKLGAAYCDYHRIMEHWKHVDVLPSMEIQYEDLVADPEPYIRSLLEFIEVDWDPNCLSFHQSKRMAQTLSMDQVRQPMHTQSIHRSRHYWDQLAPLRDVLGDLAPDK